MINGARGLSFPILASTWREVRRLDVVSLLHATCLLPLSKDDGVAYERIVWRFVGHGTEISVLEMALPHVALPNDAKHERSAARFDVPCDAEDEEVVDETERFREEIERERRRGKFPFAELEDKESNLERLHKYLAQVEVKRCARVLEVFAKKIYEHQRIAEGEEGR